MRPTISLRWLLLFALLALPLPACKRKPKTTLEAIDQIDRRSNLPQVEPVSEGGRVPKEHELPKE